MYIPKIFSIHSSKINFNAMSDNNNEATSNFAKYDYYINNPLQDTVNQDIYIPQNSNYAQIVNKFCRWEPIVCTSRGKQIIINDINNISSALEKCSIPNNIQVYRTIDEKFISEGLGEKELADYMKNIDLNKVTPQNINYVKDKLLGTTFKEDAFVCTFINKNFDLDNGCILETINVPKGTEAVVLPAKKNDKNSNTLIINRNYRFAITDIGISKNKAGIPKWLITTHIVQDFDY